LNEPTPGVNNKKTNQKGDGNCKKKKKDSLKGKKSRLKGGGGECGKKGIRGTEVNVGKRDQNRPGGSGETKNCVFNPKT